MYPLLPVYYCKQYITSALCMYYCNSGGEGPVHLPLFQVWVISQGTDKQPT